jgi:hypothetical protein
MRPKEYPKIIAHSTDCLHNCCINCDCKNITFVNSTKYLGIIIDEDFTWAQQIKKISNKIRSVIKEVKLAKSRLCTESLRTIYFALAYSHLTYGISAWGHATLTPLINLQEKLLYVMASKTQLKTNDNNVYKIWNVLPLNLAFDQIILTLKYFDQNHGVPRVHNYRTRTALNKPLIMPKSLNKYQERTWKYIMPRLWNKLPSELKNYQTHETAKENIKLWFLMQIQPQNSP